jgi:hypothetical protein
MTYSALVSWSAILELGLAKLRQIREEPAFAQSVERLGGARRIDLALTSLMSALAFRPEGFPLVGDHGLRIAKTESIPDDDGSMIPPLRLYFQISDAGVVVLWWIEEIPGDEDITF